MTPDQKLWMQMWGSWSDRERAAVRWAMQAAVDQSTEQLQYMVARWRFAAYACLSALIGTMIGLLIM